MSSEWGNTKDNEIARLRNRIEELERERDEAQIIVEDILDDLEDEGRDHGWIIPWKQIPNEGCSRSVRVAGDQDATNLPPLTPADYPSTTGVDDQLRAERD